jgi:hypothetical protein
MLTEGARKIYHGRRVGQGWSTGSKICVLFLHGKDFSLDHHILSHGRTRQIGRSLKLRSVDV